MGQLPGQFSSSFREEAGLGGGQWLQEAFGPMAQGLGEARLLAPSNLGLSGPTWLKVGVPWLVRVTLVKALMATRHCPARAKGAEQGPQAAGPAWLS